MNDVLIPANTTATVTGLSEDQRRALGAQIQADPAFRTRLLADPRRAAAELGIALADWEHEEILRAVAALRRNSLQADGILDRPTEKAVIPILVLS